VEKDQKLLLQTHNLLVFFIMYLPKSHPAPVAKIFITLLYIQINFIFFIIFIIVFVYGKKRERIN